MLFDGVPAHGREHIHGFEKHEFRSCVMGAIKETDKQVEKSPGHLWNLSPAQPLGAQVE